MTHAHSISEAVKESSVILTVTSVNKKGEHYDIVGDDSNGVSMKDTCVLNDANQVPVVGEKWSFAKNESGHPIATFVEKA